jgi:hypothetical protein
MKSVTMLIPALVLQPQLASALYVHADMNLQPHSKLVDTLCFLSCPECSNGNAGKDTAEYCPGGVDEHNSHGSPACDLKLLCGEDSLILEENRAFCQAQSQVIHNQA